MYHCKLYFYLAGYPCEAFDIIRKMQPMENFTHEFFECITLEDALINKADVVFAYMQDMNAKEMLRTLVEGKRKDAQLILLADRNQIEDLTEGMPEVTDIWIIPMSEEEIRFRFLRWQQTCKMRKDFWQTSHYLETTINSVPNLVWYKDKEGIHEKVNDSFCKTVNKTKEQVEGRDHYYIWDVDPDDPENEGHDCMESDLEVIRKEEICVSEEVVKTGDGMRLFTTYKAPLYDLDGSVMGTVGVGIDVTGERSYEQEIIKKSQTIEKIFTTLDCGVLCHTVDGKRILNINEATLRILGYDSKDELMANGFFMIAASVIEDDKPMLWDCISRLKKEGDSVNVEYRVRHKDGKIRHVMGNIKLLRENGELFYQRFLLDCTAQKMQEEENERRQMELLQALSMDYNLVCCFNLDTGIGFPIRVDEYSRSVFGTAFAKGTSIKENMESYICKLVYEDDREMMRRECSKERIKQELEKRQLYTVNYRTLINDEIKYYEMKVASAGGLDGDCSAVLGFRSVDEETRNEMEQKKLLEDALLQANKANKAKSLFLSNMSHDIRTPMNAIVGFTTLAAARIDCKEQVLEYLKKITASGNHMLNLINDVLDMSRIESGKMKFEEISCSLSDILYELNNIVQADVHKKRLELSMEAVNVVHDVIYCDKLRLNQVLLNIISNSIKYTNPEGSISLRITEKAVASKGYADYEFCVKDTGIGMSREFLSHIFEPFEREKNTTISGIQGTGLGMAITRNIVDMLNGTIEVKSELGVGTEVTVSFTFRLDTKAEDLRDIPELKKCRALVVDADFKVCTNVAFLLRQIGMQPEWVCSGEEALFRTSQAAGQDCNYRVYIIDMLLPDMDVIETIRQIRKISKPEESAIILTAYDWSDIADEARDAGVTAFCGKPLFLSELKNCLRSVVNVDKTYELDIDKASDEFRGGRILLAEDNELNQEIAVAILGDAGFDAEVAGNGQIAVDMLEKSQPGYYKLVLMDVQMPVMNGYEATKAIRSLENQELASIPIFAMTANAFEEDRQEALKSGMNGHIAKPIDVEKLFDALRSVLK